jgi:RNA polymerase sigma-70 factor (ECF subfamily)
MPDTNPAPDESDRPPDHFVTTHWSEVLAAQHPSRAEARAALESLCRTYWPPLHAFIRRTGRNENDARDLAQGFFEHFLAKNGVGAAQPERGRFRNFLLLRLKTFLSNERAKAGAQKRGGAAVILSLDDDSVEARYQLEPSETATPETIYERIWAQAVIAAARAALAADHERAGNSDLFAGLTQYLDGDEDKQPYVHVAGQLHTTEDAIKQAVKRMRERFAALIRREIARTVDAHEVEDELRHLLRVLGGG